MKPKKERYCYCCADAAIIEHKYIIKIDFCRKHTVIDFYKKQVAEFELKQLKKRHGCQFFPESTECDYCRVIDEVLGEMANDYNWKRMEHQKQIWSELQPKIANWKAEGEPEPIGYFTDGLLKWICLEIKRAKQKR